MSLLHPTQNQKLLRNHCIIFCFIIFEHAAYSDKELWAWCLGLYGIVSYWTEGMSVPKDVAPSQLCASFHRRLLPLDMCLNPSTHCKLVIFMKISQKYMERTAWGCFCMRATMYLKIYDHFWSRWKVLGWHTETKVHYCRKLPWAAVGSSCPQPQHWALATAVATPGAAQPAATCLMALPFSSQSQQGHSSVPIHTEMSVSWSIPQGGGRSKRSHNTRVSGPTTSPTQALGVT